MWSLINRKVGHLSFLNFWFGTYDQSKSIKHNQTYSSKKNPSPVLHFPTLLCAEIWQRLEPVATVKSPTLQAPSNATRELRTRGLSLIVNGYTHTYILLYQVWLVIDHTANVD